MHFVSYYAIFLNLNKVSQTHISEIHPPILVFYLFWVSKYGMGMTCVIKLFLIFDVSRYLIHLNPSGANIVLQVFNDTAIFDEDLEDLKSIEKV